MLEELKEEQIVNKVGGQFRLTALIQKRMLEILYGPSGITNRMAYPEGKVLQVVVGDRVDQSHVGGCQLE